MAKSSGSVKHGQRHTPHRIHLGPDAIHGDAVLPRREESLLALATTRCGVARREPKILPMFCEPDHRPCALPDPIFTLANLLAF
jgi:hypothetical protein